MGWVVGTFVQPDSMATLFGQALAALGAVPVTQPDRDPENVTAAMLVIIPALLIAGGVLLAGSRHLHREMALMLAKLKAAPTRHVGGRLRCCGICQSPNILRSPDPPADPARLPRTLMR